MLSILQVITLVTILSLANGRPEPQSEADKAAKTTFRKDTQDERLNYEFKFDTSNGITRAEIGDFEQITDETGYHEIKGYYSYVAPDGIRYTVTYIANDKGFQPKLHKSAPNQLIPVGNLQKMIVVDGIDDDRIGTKLLMSLGGGGIG